MNYYDFVANFIFINLFSIAVLFGIQPIVHMEELSVELYLSKVIDIVQFNIYLVLFAVFVTYLNRLHCQVAAQSLMQDGIIIKSEQTGKIIYVNQAAVNFIEDGEPIGVAEKPHMKENTLKKKQYAKIDIEELYKNSVSKGCALKMPEEFQIKNLTNLDTIIKENLQHDHQQINN